MSGEAVISHDVLARYAADAAGDVAGVRSVVDGHLPSRRGVRIAEDADGVRVELHLAVDWGVSIPAVGAEVQRHVATYLEQMADVRPAAVDVVVDDVAAP